MIILNCFFQSTERNEHSATGTYEEEDVELCSLIHPALTIQLVPAAVLNHMNTLH